MSADRLEFQGVVVRVHGLTAVVEVADREVPCTARVRDRRPARREHSRVVAGDRVAGHFLDESLEAGVIERVEPRRGRLARASNRLRGREQVVAANVDLLVCVVAALDPPIEPHLIDRFQVIAAQGGMGFALCVNKIDLAGAALRGEVQSLADPYRALGFPVVLTSALTGEGLDDLRALLAGRASVLAGPSGAGKSSLVNALRPGPPLATAEVNRKSREGVHTTTVTRLLRLAGGGHIVDTPGVRDLALSALAPGDLAGLMPEFAALRGGCRFKDCAHLAEPGCAVIAAAGRGEISPQRLGHYQFIRRELEAAARASGW
ncbi:MAG: ribosome small subunit-dependent GTPase A [Planctomycetes bacterium]|nr:ribosome small subunit-dependent GTPase A [Planctomycetota bacterium]